MLISNGDVVFIDGSSTTQYIGRYLVDKKGITVITCNMMLADFLSEHGIETYCTGGKVVEYPGILGGDMALEMLSKFNIDIAFFSSTAFNTCGQVLAYGEGGVRNHKAYRACSDKLVYLCGSDKFNTVGAFVSLSLSDIDFFVSDAELPEKTKEKYKSTTFLFTKE